MHRKNVVAVVVATLILGLSVSARAQTPTPPAPAAASVTCEVVQVNGTYLVVKLRSGDLQVFNVNPERTFLVDGTSLTVHQLKPGTILTVTYTSTLPAGAPVTTVTGKVWYVSGHTVILTLPDGTNQSYNVPPSFEFVVNDKPMSLQDLRKGMKVTAKKIPQPPAVAFRDDIVITGTTRK